MSRIKKCISRFITVMTAAAMAMSVFAGTAFASDAEAYSVTVSEMKAGVSYSAGISWSVTEDANTYALSSTAVTMITGYFGNEVEIIPLEDSTYNVIISFGGETGYSSAITGIYYYAGSDFSDDDGAVLSSASAEDETAAFTVNVSSIESDIYLSVVISGAMAGMFSPGADIVMTVDTSAITTTYTEETEDTDDADDTEGTEDSEDSEDSGNADDSSEEESTDDDASSDEDLSGDDDSAEEESEEETDSSDEEEQAGDDGSSDEDSSGSEVPEENADDSSSDDETADDEGGLSDNSSSDDEGSDENAGSSDDVLSEDTSSGDESADDNSSDGSSSDDAGAGDNSGSSDNSSSDDNSSGSTSSDTGSSEDTQETEDAGNTGDAEDTEDTEDAADADGSADAEDEADDNTETSSGSAALSAGTYSIDVSLSAYVSGMGGIEFGSDLLEGAQLTVDSEGSCFITLYFVTAEVTIYGSTLETFVDASESAPGYYDGSEVKTASYTLSEQTALNPSGEEVNYVDSMTFAVSEGTSSYYLWIYINSGFMGVQFCDGSGTGSSNTPGTATPYAAVLTIDWAGAVLISSDYDEDLSDGAGAAEDEEISVSDSGSSDDSGSSSDDSLSSDDEDDDEVPYGLETGTYYPSASLSAYISAMGGVQFGSGLLSSVKVIVNEDGTYTITVYFTTSSVSIYSLTVNTFIDASDSAPGYYDADGNLVYASYTLSSSTAADADGNAVHYVDSMTFTVSELQSAYYLYIYVNSSVMGVQFCDGSGTGSSNTPGVETPYAAVLTINWSSVGATVESSPVTGQEGSMSGWLLLLAAAACGIVLLTHYRKRNLE